MNKLTYTTNMSADEILNYCTSSDIQPIVLPILDRLFALEKEIDELYKALQLEAEELELKDYRLDKILKGINKTSTHEELASLIKEAYKNNILENI